MGGAVDIELVRNEAYRLTYVDPSSGFGLLYSDSLDQCAFLNPYAAVLWRDGPAPFNPASLLSVASRGMKLAGAAPYLSETISQMVQEKLLLPASGGAECANADVDTPQHYPLQQIYFYVTRECNARCFHCYQPTRHTTERTVSGSPQAPTLSVDDFVSFLEDALPLGAQSVKITGGEPLLRPDLGELISGIYGLGLSISIETNGFLLDEKTADLLAEHGVDVSISLDGSTPALHDTLRGLTGSFEQATRAMRLLAERGASPKAIMAVSRRNLGEVEKVVETARESGCSIVKLNPVNTLGLARELATRDVLLQVDEIVALYNRRRELEAGYGVFVFLEGPPSFASIDEFVTGHAAACPFRTMVGVLADGSLSFCGIGNSYPGLVIGRVGEIDLASWWREAPQLRQMRESVAGALEGVCSRCILRSICHGSCRALAYGEFGTFSAPHPWCQASFERGIFPPQYLKGELQARESHHEEGR